MTDQPDHRGPSTPEAEITAAIDVLEASDTISWWTRDSALDHLRRALGLLRGEVSEPDTQSISEQAGESFVLALRQLGAPPEMVEQAQRISREIQRAAPDKSSEKERT